MRTAALVAIAFVGVGLGALVAQQQHSKLEPPVVQERPGKMLKFLGAAPVRVGLPTLSAHVAREVAVQQQGGSWLHTATADLVFELLDEAELHGFATMTRELPAWRQQHKALNPSQDSADKQLPVSEQALWDAWRQGPSTSAHRLHRLRVLHDAHRKTRPTAQNSRSSAAAKTLEQTLIRALAGLALNVQASPRRRPLLKAKRIKGHPREYQAPEVVWSERSWREPGPELIQELRILLQGEVDQVRQWFRSKQPPYPQYRRLLDAAKHYRARCRAGGWPLLEVPAPRKEIITWEQPRGWTTKRRRVELVPWTPPAPHVIRKVQKRLAHEGFMHALPSGVWDATTTAAVERYQASRNIKRSGVFDVATAEALNVTCSQRVAQLVLNLHRWRHSAIGKAQDYVLVNIPGYELRYIRDGIIRRSEAVVVGKSNSWTHRTSRRRIFSNATPLMSDHIETIVFNPTWTMPGRLSKRMKERAAKDPTYLARRGMKQVGSGSHTKIVQGRSNRNALGDVKLLFPNSENIYLHDTSDRWAFSRNRRDLSHGCVRVANAVSFAGAILADDYAHRGQPLSTLALRQLAAVHRPKSYTLATPLPIFLEYYTATVDDDGHVRFHPDIYKYDAQYFKRQG